MKTKFIRLEITQDILDQADDESDVCPVTVAFGLLGFNIDVTQNDIEFLVKNEPSVPIPMSFMLRHFLEQFTRGRFVEPCSFTVEVPDG